MRGCRTVTIVDAGEPRNFVAQHMHGLYSRDGENPRDIRKAALEQFLKYPTAKFIEGTVKSISGEKESFTLSLESGETLFARRIILACGVIDVLPDIPGLKECWGRGVLICPYCHGYEFKDQALGVILSTPMSVDLTLLVRDQSATVTAFTNGAQFSEDVLARLRRHVTVVTAPIASVEHSAGELTGVRLADASVVPLRALYVVSRTVQRDVVRAAGVALTELGRIQVSAPGNETSVPGIFAAGDVDMLFQKGSLAIADAVLSGVFCHRSLIAVDRA